MAVVKLSGRPENDNKPAYVERVFEILVSFEYDLLVFEFEEQAVSQAMAATIGACWVTGLSERMCALLIWSFTMNSQIIPLASRSTKH